MKRRKVIDGDKNRQMQIAAAETLVGDGVTDFAFHCIWCEKNDSSNSSLLPVSKRYLFIIGCEREFITERVKSPRLTKQGEKKTPTIKFAADKC